MKLSFVATLYYSLPYIEEFYNRSCTAAARITPDFEIILVNDGSPDMSLQKACELHNRDARVTVVDLSRNFGHHKAIMTGLAYATGDLIMLIDVDLEEPPEIVLDFYEAFSQSDADVVYGVQKTREGNILRRIGGGLYYRLYNRLSQVQVPSDTLIARLMTRRYVQRLLEHREQLFGIDVLMEITGFKQIPVLVNKHYKGSTTYSFQKRVALAINGITSQSNKPLQYIAYLGVLITIPSGLYILLLLTQGLLGITTEVEGWTSVMVSLWFLGGLIIFVLGIIAVYLSVIFVEIKARPYTVIKDVFRTTSPHQTLSDQKQTDVDQLRLISVIPENQKSTAKE
ncbi:MAG: glycosyltransferase family 2 protein [Anaerolineae bacterium]|nr:glycosyltransferase family 2 protein [Anaerolineae bacterium]